MFSFRLYGHELILYRITHYSHGSQKLMSLFGSSCAAKDVQSKGLRLGLLAPLATNALPSRTSVASIATITTYFVGPAWPKYTMQTLSTRFRYTLYFGGFMPILTTRSPFLRRNGMGSSSRTPTSKHLVCGFNWGMVSMLCVPIRHLLEMTNLLFWMSTGSTRSLWLFVTVSMRSNDTYSFCVQAFSLHPS